MLDTQRLNRLFLDYTQDEDKMLREYAADTLLASLWVETGTDRERVAAVLCAVAPPETEQTAPKAAVRLCQRFADSDAQVPLPPPAPDERRKWIGENAAAVALDALRRLIAYTKGAGEEVESPEARAEAQCVFDLFRLMERLRLSEMVSTAFGFLYAGNGVTPSWYRALQLAACRGLASLPLGDIKKVIAMFALADSRTEAMLPLLDELHSPEYVPDLLLSLKSSFLKARRGLFSPSADPAIQERILWATTRALERIGDRRAIKALRNLVNESEDPNRSVRVFHSPVNLDYHAPPGLSSELIAELKRVIVSLQSGGSRDKWTLLRPAKPPTPTDLLRPSARSEETRSQRDREELLRPE